MNVADRQKAWRPTDHGPGTTVTTVLHAGGVN